MYENLIRFHPSLSSSWHVSNANYHNDRESFARKTLPLSTLSNFPNPRTKLCEKSCSIASWAFGQWIENWMIEEWEEKYQQILFSLTDFFKQTSKRTDWETKTDISSANHKKKTTNTCGKRIIQTKIIQLICSFFFLSHFLRRLQLRYTMNWNNSRKKKNKKGG